MKALMISKGLYLEKSLSVAIDMEPKFKIMTAFFCGAVNTSINKLGNRSGNQQATFVYHLSGWPAASFALWLRGKHKNGRDFSYLKNTLKLGDRWAVTYIALGC